MCCHYYYYYVFVYLFVFIDSIDCILCPEDYWSNANGTACVPKAVEFLSHDAMGITLTVIAFVGAFLTVTVLLIFFVQQRNPYSPCE